MPQGRSLFNSPGVIRMSLSTKSISPAVMVAVLLSACGGGDGSGEGGKAASSSPKTAVIATSSIHTGTGDVASSSSTGTPVTPVSTAATGAKSSRHPAGRRADGAIGGYSSGTKTRRAG